MLDVCSLYLWSTGTRRESVLFGRGEPSFESVWRHLNSLLIAMEPRKDINDCVTELRPCTIRTILGLRKTRCNKLCKYLQRKTLIIKFKWQLNSAFWRLHNMGGTTLCKQSLYITCLQIFSASSEMILLSLNFVCLKFVLCLMSRISQT